VKEGEAGVTLESLKQNKTALYNSIKKEIENHYLTLPPSAAVAGLYASVDRDRGVWKAPANVSVASVSGPRRKLTELENDVLNVDDTTGKSINAIRSFSGKGTLRGARTLAGNDNEWRYVPVRRLFNYIEESIQKATAYAVFEPNTAMTWLKLRSMVQSFLDNLWRQGALAGSTAEDAFFVQVGLGTTMTADDIANGKLIIKVGIAAVRPAEFIILEFSHKTQES
jgi:phage tail sheath protein FI